MDQSRPICPVHIKEIFQVIIFVTCGSLKDSLSVSTNLNPKIRVTQYCFVGLKFIQKLTLGSLIIPVKLSDANNFRLQEKTYKKSMMYN